MLLCVEETQEGLQRQGGISNGPSVMGKKRRLGGVKGVGPCVDRYNKDKNNI